MLDVASRPTAVLRAKVQMDDSIHSFVQSFVHSFIHLQVAQLSQRDRVAECIGWPKVEDWNWEKCKIKAITPFIVIQGHRGRYQSKACMRLPICG